MPPQPVTLSAKHPQRDALAKCVDKLAKIAERESEVVARTDTLHRQVVELVEHGKILTVGLSLVAELARLKLPNALAMASAHPCPDLFEGLVEADAVGRPVLDHGTERRKVVAMRVEQRVKPDE